MSEKKGEGEQILCKILSCVCNFGANDEIGQGPIFAKTSLSYSLLRWQTQIIELERFSICDRFAHMEMNI